MFHTYIDLACTFKKHVTFFLHSYNIVMVQQKLNDDSTVRQVPHVSHLSLSGLPCYGTHYVNSEQIVK